MIIFVLCSFKPFRSIQDPELFFRLVCILCQEEQPVTGPGKGFVYGTFVQRSTVMCQNTTKLTETMDSMGKVLENSPFCINPDVLVAPFVSSCGHPMHASCWQSYLEGLIARERRRYRFVATFFFI